MRIEILVDNEDPQIFPLNKSKITIGSHESCEIQLHTDGVSRKHLQVTTEDDKYYVIDQGSTNGTYINEERLVPGRRVEFTSFFPVRLGDKVLITLLSDTDADDLGYSEENFYSKPEASSPGIKRPVQEESDSTRTISLRDLQSVKTEKLVQKRQETVKKRKLAPPPPKKAPLKDRRRMLLVQIFSVALVGAAAYYNFFVLKPEPEVEIKVPLKEIGQVTKVEPMKPFFSQVDKTDLTPLTRFPEMAKEITCTSELELFFCKLYDEKKTKHYGVLQIGTMINSMVDGLPYLELARAMLPKPVVKQGSEISPEQIQKFESDVKYTAMILFLNDLPELSEEMFKGLNLTFSLQITDITTEPQYIAAAVVPGSFISFKERLKDKVHFENARRYGAEAIYFLKDYFTYY